VVGVYFSTSPVPSAPSVAVTELTRTGPGVTTTSPMATTPVCSCLSDFCQRLTAFSVAAVNFSSGVPNPPKPSPARFCSMSRTSGPSVTPGPTSRYMGSSPLNSTTGRASTW
jgi:hypothetical protein